MPKSKLPVGNVGYHYGRRDMDRVGIFNEDSYLHGVPYPAFPISWSARGKGKQMEAGALKEKTGLQDCYFEKTPFKSINVKDPYRDPLLPSTRVRGKKEGGIFKPPGFGERSSCRGDFYGTFRGRIDAFSPSLRPGAAHQREPPNFKTAPGKKGSYGYSDITINRFPEYKPQGPTPRKFVSPTGLKFLAHPSAFYPTLFGKPYFGPNPYKSDRAPGPLYVKRRATEPSAKAGHWYPPHVPRDPANNHDGCFTAFPKHMPDPYLAYKKRPSDGSAGVFWPPTRGCDITKYTLSVVNHNVDFRVNDKNWRIVKSFTYKNDVNDG